jgi:hypothetical protein
MILEEPSSQEISEAVVPQRLEVLRNRRIDIGEKEVACGHHTLHDIPGMAWLVHEECRRWQFKRVFV